MRELVTALFPLVMPHQLACAPVRANPPADPPHAVLGRRPERGHPVEKGLSLGAVSGRMMA